MKAKSEIFVFRQGADESFCETWEKFKMMLRKCRNHGCEDIAQLNIFLIGLRSDKKMLLDVAACGTMMALDVEQVTRIIDALASTDYKDQHDKQGTQKEGLLEDALLAKNKILTQQIEQLIAQMAKLTQQLYVVHSSQSQSQPIKCDFCGGDHPNGHCFYQNNSPKAENALAKIVIEQKKSMATIRNLEIQAGQMIKQIAQIVKRLSEKFLVDTITNPKEHCINVVTKKEEKDETKRKRDERKKEKTKEVRRKK